MTSQSDGDIYKTLSAMQARRNLTFMSQVIMECYASLSRQANDILKAISGTMKWDHAESDDIPELEALTPENFNLHETFRHGFPSQPTCLAYDPVQQLLAIGTENGTVLLLGMPGLERWLSHPTKISIRQMLFITNKGFLVTNGDNETLYVWSLQGKSPSILHKLKFRAELHKPTTISWTYGSEWMYVGTDSSYVFVVHIESFKLSGYSIRWIKTRDVYQLDKPGDVVAVQEHPLDQGKLLIAYSRGICVLWDLKNEITEGRFSYNLSENHTLTSMCWLGNGKSFACSYSDGCVALWNPAKPGNKPEKTIFPHESDHDRATFKPVNKVQSVNTDRGTWYICSGGLPEDSPSSIHSLTIKQSKSFSHLSTTSPILDFLCLPSSPFPYDCQKPFALVILTKNELVVHDLQSSGFPTFSLPSALDVHLSPVTCVQYCSKCPEELIASLQSVNSKLTAENKSTKPWPLKGGKWGEEVYPMSTDLIITGHADGSVRFWFSSSVIFQPVFTVNTSRYFKMKHMANLIEGGHALQVEDQRMPNGSPQSQRNTRFPATGQHKAHSSTPRRIVESMIQWKSKSNLRPTTPLPEGASSPSTLGSEDFFAIQEINMCVHGLWMCVANMGGSVLTFHFKMGEATTTPKSLDVCLNYDTVFDLKGKPTSAATVPSGDWIFQEGVKDSQSGFHLTQHCQCYLETESLPVIVSSMQYSSDIGMLVIGTDQGFTVVDTVTNRCLYTLCNLTSILSVGMANPSTPAAFSTPSHKPTIMKHANLQSMFTEYLRDKGTAPTNPMVECSAKTKVCLPALLQKVEENECSVTALKVVQLQLEKQAPPTLTLWVGLASGHIAAYTVSIKRPENVGFGPPQRILKIKVIPIRFVHKSPIVSIHFLNEWGDQKLVPYKPQNLSREQGYQRSSESSKLHYAIITDEKRIQSFSFPGFVPAGKVTPPIQNNAILMSEHFTCHELPCLLSLTSSQHILVHSLPNLKPLLNFPFPLLSDIRVLCTLRVSGNGQVLYMPSTSEIQRMSITKDDRLNLPACLPDVHIHLKDSQPVDERAIRKHKVVNREKILAGRPRLYSVIEPDLTPVPPSVIEPDLTPVPPSGGQLAHIKQMLHDRMPKLSATGRTTRNLAQSAITLHDNGLCMANYSIM